MSVTYKTRIILPCLPLKICHLHIKFQETIQLPLSFMQMHVSSIFWLSPKSLDHPSKREFLSRDTSIHMFSKPSCCTNYNTSSNSGFEEVTILITICNALDLRSCTVI